MTMPLVSVIVPCYNAEKFLPRCVESVLAQTETNWELLLIDDGSTDATAELCLSYAERDPRIRSIRQENAGVSAARNAGLDAATGEYITLIDSDDALPIAALEILLAAAHREKADIAAGGMRREDENGNELWTYLPEPVTIRSAEEVTSRHIPEKNGMYSACRLLIRREFIGDTRFSPLTRGEDALFTTQLYMRCSCYVTVHEPVYCYICRSDSVMHESFRPATLDFVRAWVRIYELLKEKMPALAPRAAEIVLWQCDRVFVSGMESGDASWKNCRRELKPIRARFASLCARTARKRAANAVFMLSPELYYRLAGGHRQ